MGSQEVLQVYADLKLREWAIDPEAFFADCVFIKTVRGREPFVLREPQREALKTFQENDRVIALKARQIGFSTLVACYSLWLALFHEDQVINLFAEKQDTAVKLLGKAKYALRGLPSWVSDLLPQLTKDTELKLTFTNGSTIEAFPATSDSGRGETATLAVLDEWAAYGENAEKAWSAIEPTIDLGGRFIGLSTAQGMDNFFHDMWVSSGDKRSGFKRFFVPWSAVPERDVAWYERKREEFERQGQPWIMHQEYPRDPEEAFIKSGMVVFDVQKLRHWDVKAPMQKGHLDTGLHFLPDKDGPLEVWALPDDNCDYVIGADVAEGLAHGDFSDATIILATDQKKDGVLIHPRGTTVARYRAHVDPDLFGDELDRMARWYNTGLIGCEANAHGLTTLTRLNIIGYPRLYRTRTHDQAYNRETERLGWYTTKRTKPLMIDGLSAAIRTNEIRFWCDTLRRELMTYVRRPNGALGKEGIRDDAVISAALAWQMLNHVFEPEYRPKKEAGYMTLNWWDKQLMLDTDAEEAWI